MIYTNGYLTIHSDYEVRTVREDEALGDIDLSVDVDDRSLNLCIPGENTSPVSRMQLPRVKFILIRYCSRNDSDIATIHFLNRIDLHSSILNFELQYQNYMIYIENGDGCIDFKVKKK
ncbi:MAG: hypothetical protein ACOYVK_11970 [Bacillota bacterium]